MRHDSWASYLSLKVISSFLYYTLLGCYYLFKSTPYLFF
ncbi:hypothetical protein BMETH_674_1 [methanotrophic bacterial endosymbiont of Bathymodiolus sp.]|nr:hypothetical protein BMETH_674_1 [methanotrophic bacterial endosymbiont of Bathymodiolus sp.]